MAARSKPSSLRSTLRGGHDLDHVSPVIDKPQQNGYLPSLRSKRSRIASISDQDPLKKKIKIENNFKQNQSLRIPLRSRRQDASAPASPPRSLDTEPVLNTNRKLPQLKPKAINEPDPIDTIPAEEVHRTEYEEQLEAEQKAKHAALEKEKRTLRSHDGGSRSKSELAQYFQSYDQMISLDPTAPELITPKTVITFIDDLYESTNDDAASKSIKSRLSHANGSHTTRRPPPSFTSIPLHKAQRVDLSTLAQPGRRSTKDPLNTDVFIKAHRRPERQEKQLRNIEKERAQHEKVQLDRLLDELKGPDWLRVMGISGITESEKKLYEPKRIYFIREVTALIEKFKYWKEEEKRRKIERDQALLEQMEEEEESEEAEAEVEDEEQNESSEDADDEEEGEEGAEQSEREDEVEEAQSPHSSPTNSSDVLDAQAARQLLQEASSADSPSTMRSPPKPRIRKNLQPSRIQKPRSRAKEPQPLSDPAPADRTKHATRPIHSFFSKPSPPALVQNPHHQPDPTNVQDGPAASALGHRRGRSKPQKSNGTAFGKAIHAVEAVPSAIAEREFGLPNGILNQGKGVRANTKASRRAVKNEAVNDRKEREDSEGTTTRRSTRRRVAKPDHI